MYMLKTKSRAVRLPRLLVQEQKQTTNSQLRRENHEVAGQCVSSWWYVCAIRASYHVFSDRLVALRCVVGLMQHVHTVILSFKDFEMVWYRLDLRARWWRISRSCIYLQFNDLLWSSNVPSIFPYNVCIHKRLGFVSIRTPARDHADNVLVWKFD